ncbi:MAG: RnfABCDGE type electron transport complex subunit B [Rhodoferax sp.]
MRQAADAARDALVSRLLQALPQTQCRRCDYPDCAGYAAALAGQQAEVNQCPPGGDEGVHRLAQITGQPVLPLNPAYGAARPRLMAFIDEDWCIGCTLCLPACPTDAIVGSNKRMHTVIEAYCTGCELCVPVCPVDCIVLENASGKATGWAAWSDQDAATARRRYASAGLRRSRHAAEKQSRLETKAMEKLTNVPQHSKHTDSQMLQQKRAVIDAALARARAKRAKPG